MIKSLLTTSLCFGLLSSFSQTHEEKRLTASGEVVDSSLKPVSYAHILIKSRNEGCVSDLNGKFRLGVFPGDTLCVSAVSFHQTIIEIPGIVEPGEYHFRVTMRKDTVYLKELVIYPWPSTYSQLRREFMEIEVKDPKDDIDLHLPSMKDIIADLKTPGVPGQIGIYFGPGPFSLLYNQFSKEARSRKIYTEALKIEKANYRYNKVVVSRVTGLKNEDDILIFMEYCALQVKFILESTDYELYAAILDCFDEFCRKGFLPDPENE